MLGKLNSQSKSFLTVRKISVYLSVAVLIALIFFSYVSHVDIAEYWDDFGNLTESGQKLQTALTTLFWVFVALAPLAVGTLVFFFVLWHKERKEYYRLNNKSKLGKRVHAFDVVNFAWMAVFCVLCIYPIFYVLIGSFNQGADYAKGGVYLFPRVFTFENYRVVLEKGEMWHAYLVTLGRTVIGTVTALVFTSVVAYAMSRPNLKGKKFFYWANIFTMFFNGGLVPYFLIISSIGLFDSFWVYIIPGLYSVYNMIVISSFFSSISSELHEAALVDGASEFRIWWQIYMPLSKPVLATVALWLAVGHWNAYFDTMIYAPSENLHTLQYFLLRAIQSSTMTEGMTETMMQRVSAKTISLAAIIISVVPVMFFFPFVRKNFQSGIMIGSLKG